MNRIEKHTALLLLTLATLCSCEKDPREQQPAGGKTIHYSATVESGIETRATLNGGNQYVFEEGDRLYVESIDADAGNLYGILTLVSGANARTATFEGDLTCVNDFIPVSTTPLSATLIGRYERGVHSFTDGKLNSARTYRNEYASDLADAVSKYSDFVSTGSPTFGDHSFTLEQKSSFLVFSVKFDPTEVPDATSVTAKVYNDYSGTPELLRSATVRTTTVGYFTRLNFVAAFPGGSVALSDAALSVQWGEVAPVVFDDISSQALAVNTYYSISRTTIETHNYFHIKATKDGTTVTFKYTDGSVQYSDDPDIPDPWPDYDGRTFSLNKDDVIYFKGTRTECDCNGTTQLFFANKVCNIGGEIASLLANPNSLADNAFRSAFSNGNSNNTNPAAVTWVNIDTNDPLILPDITATNCYREMFRACTSLTSIPDLPATTVSPQCYFNMFRKCTGLTTANIELPAMTLAEDCYRELFRECSNLTSVPIFPAPVLAARCYQQMLSKCTSLTSVTCLATDISATDCTLNWMSDVTNDNTHTFYKASTMTVGQGGWGRGNNGIPSQWLYDNYTPTP